MTTLSEQMPRVLPPTWKHMGFIQVQDVIQSIYRSTWGLQVIGSLDVIEGHHWLHVSVSHDKRLPSWNEISEVKNLFFGDVLVIQVLPPKKQYVNVHPNTLHLWRCLSGPTLPGFPGEDH